MALSLEDQLARGLSDDGIGGFDAEAAIKKFDPNVHIASPAEVRRDALTKSKSVLSSYETLRGIILRHEETIQKRWTKKTRQQRQKILLGAWPGMAVSHRPDFKAFRRTNRSKQPVSRDKDREYYMWPYINQEDLLKPKNLLLLLNSRGRNPPSDFAGAEYDAMHLGRVTGNLTPVFLNEYTMILNGAYDITEYGKLVSWDDNGDAFEWMTSQKQFIPGEGLLILEAQEKLLKFLVNCCQQILHEIPIENLSADTFPIQPEPYLKTEKESSGFDSLVVMASEAPYRLPAKLDIGRIVAVLGARVSAAEDHLWDMREDPAYFAEKLIELKEHRMEVLKDECGNEHHTLKVVGQNLFWARVCGSITFKAYLKLELFSELHQQAQELVRLQRKHAAAISPMKDLPDELLGALLKFQYYLEQAAKGPQAELSDSVAPSPPWRKYFVRQAPPNTSTSIMQIKSKSGVEMGDVEVQTRWILKVLWEDDRKLFLMSMPLLIDELGRLTESEPRAKDLLSAHVAGIIGDLTILSHCLTQLNLFLPWARSFETEMVDREDAIKDDYAHRFQGWTEIMDTLSDKHLMQVARLGNPADGRFAYPFEKRRTKQNIESLQRAERNLDEFWAGIDRLVYEKCGSLENTAVRRVLSQSRIMQRTADWVESAPSTTKPSGRDTVSDSELTSLYQPLSTIYIGKRGSDSSPETQKSKSKAKTRESTSKADTPPVSVPSNANPHPDPEPESIPVDARSFKVFRTLFFNPTVTSSPGEVSWNDFLHAMTSTGLFAAEKLYGSVWQFQKLVGGDQSRIQFHEPHPRGKIPFTTARRHGRRLNRAFGWIGDMFVLKEK